MVHIKTINEYIYCISSFLIHSNKRNQYHYYQKVMERPTNCEICELGDYLVFH